MVIFAGLSAFDSRRARETLEGFQLYAVHVPWYVVGGLAERYYLQGLGGQIPKRFFNGVDLVAPNILSDLRPRFIKRFMVVHHHQDYAALVDRVTGVKVGVFAPRYPGKASIRELVKDLKMPVQSLPEQLASLLEDLLKLSRNPPEPVDTKQFVYMDYFVEVLTHPNCPWPDIIWAQIKLAWQNRHPGEPSFMDMKTLAYDLRDRQRDLVRPGVYTSLRRRLRQLFAKCPDCLPSSPFPLTPTWKAALAMLSRRRLL